MVTHLRRGHCVLKYGCIVFAACCALSCFETLGQDRVASITSIYLDGQGRVHIVRGGVETLGPFDKHEVQASKARIAEDNRTVGWLAESENASTSYPIPFALVLYRDSKVVRRISPGQAIWDWGFRAGGQR